MTASETPIPLTDEQAVEILVGLSCPRDHAEGTIAQMKYETSVRGPMEYEWDLSGGTVILTSHADLSEYPPRFVFHIRVTGALEDIAAQYLGSADPTT